MLHGINKLNFLNLILLNNYHFFTKARRLVVSVKRHGKLVKMQATSMLLHLFLDTIRETIEEPRLSVLNPVNFSWSKGVNFVKGVDIVLTLDN